MKKITLLTAAVLSVTALGFPSLTVEAGNIQVSQNANKNIIVIKGEASRTDLQSVLKNLQNCFPSIQIPCLPDNSIPIPPDNEPDTDLPDNNIQIGRAHV